MIELHILHSFPVTCLNRDDLGAPKSALFGGTMRARVSSQCWKRAIRKLAGSFNNELFQGHRTRYLIHELEKQFLQKGKGEKESKVLADALGLAFGKLDEKHEGSIKTLLYFSPGEIENIIEATLELDLNESIEKALAVIEDDKKYKKALISFKKPLSKAAKKLKNFAKDAADISIFGRMVADDSSLTLEGAGLFSHALSTHSVVNEIDFFSAVDDMKPDQDDAGAGHIGTLEYNSACYYRYIGLNLDLLWDDDHLGALEEEERKKVLEAFIQAVLSAVPEARKNSMLGHNPPSYVLGMQRSGQPLSLVNAFENPIISDHGYVEKSQIALLNHWSKLKETYNLDENIKTEINIPEHDINHFVESITKGAY